MNYSLRKKSMKTLSRYLAAAFLFLVVCLSYMFAKEPSMVTKSFFGKLPDGREVYQFVLTNASKAHVTVINYGAIVASIVVPDRNGKLEDVVLGYDSLPGYIGDKAFLGASVGRYGNRIAKGRFTLEGKQYQLTVNDGENHLHGGGSAFNKALWDAHVVSEGPEPSIEMTHVSPDGEEGYPGNLEVSITYTWTEKNELRIEYKGTTDKITIFNPTNHSYFNISGNFTSSILDQVLTIEADSITPVDKGLIPTGVLSAVANTPMDFRTPAVIGSRIDDSSEQLLFGKGYDHNWVIRNFQGQVRKAAQVYDPKSGRILTAFTDQPGLQFYSSNFLDGSIKGKHGVAYQRRSALCLEAQCFPDSPNKPEFPSTVLKPGSVYRQTTIYQFTIQ
jgi:aldose 1-epimerase